MKKLITLLLVLFSLKASSQTYTLNYDSVRVGKTANSSVLIPDDIYLKGLSKGNLSIRTDGKVIHNDTAYAQVANTNTKFQVSQKTNLVQYPDSMSWRPPFQIYQQGGTFYTTPVRSLMADKIATMKPYYMSPTGSDSNDGLSVATPVKTYSYARNTLNAELVYLLPGKYKRDAFYGTTVTGTGKDLVIIGIGKVIVSSADTGTPSWTNLGSGIYQTTLADVGTVVDNAYGDKYGFPFKLQKVNTIGGLTDTLSSYYVNGTDVRVHLTADRAPDSNVDLLLQASPGLEYRATSGYLYMENITFMGGSFVFYARPTPNLTTASTAVVLSYNCNYIYGGGNIPIWDGTDTADGYNVTGMAFSFVEGGYSYKNQLDGYHYGTQNTATKFFEYNVNGLENGGNDKEQEKNGSSAHNNASGVRVNGKYGGGKGPSVIDVQTGETLIVGSEAIGTVADSVSANQDFVAGSKTGSTYRKMWIYSGKSRSTARSFVGRLGFIKMDTLTYAAAPDSGNVSTGFLTGNLNATPMTLPDLQASYNKIYFLSGATSGAYATGPLTVGNSTSTTTGVGLESSLATGSATVTPARIAVRSTNNAADWSTTTPWGSYDFVSNDVTGIGSGVRGALRGGFTNAGGTNFKLSFWVSDASSLFEAANFDKDGRLNLRFTRAGNTTDSLLTILNGNVGKLAASTFAPSLRTLTINGTAQDLSANRTWNVGTVTSFGKTDGFGITSSVATSTTTPVHTIAVDTANVRSVLNSWSKAQADARFARLVFDNTYTGLNNFTADGETPDGGGITGVTRSSAGGTKAYTYLTRKNQYRWLWGISGTNELVGGTSPGTGASVGIDTVKFKFSSNGDLTLNGWVKSQHPTGTVLTDSIAVILSDGRIGRIAADAFITASSNQTGLTGDKSTSGTWTFGNTYTTSATPSIVTNVGAGTAPTVSINGTNQAGVITITVGTSPTAGTIFSCVLSGSFSYPTMCIPIFQPTIATNQSLVGINLTAGGSGTSFGLSTDVALVAGGTYSWYYHTSGY